MVVLGPRSLVADGQTGPLDANFSVNQQFDFRRLCASVDHCGLLGIHLWLIWYTATSSTVGLVGPKRIAFLFLSFAGNKRKRSVGNLKHVLR